jgi:hypothetical protein
MTKHGCEKYCNESQQLPRIRDDESAVGQSSCNPHFPNNRWLSQRVIVECITLTFSGPVVYVKHYTTSSILFCGVTRWEFCWQLDRLGIVCNLYFYGVHIFFEEDRHTASTPSCRVKFDKTAWTTLGYTIEKNDEVLQKWKR